MSDYGSEATDKAVKRVERRLSKIYSDAAKDIDQKMQDWQQGHAKRDAKYRQMVKDGKLSQQDYEAWMRGQVFQGKQWQARKKQIQEALLNADKMAMSIVTEGKLGVFATNANYIGYGLEHDSGLSTGFTLYDESTVARLIQDDPQILPMLPPEKAIKKPLAFDYYNRLMNSAITHGIIQGEDIRQIAKRIVKTTAESSYKSAVRNARTAYTGAQNAGRIEGLHQAQGLGINVKKKWMATLDSRTRDTHADLDGQIVDVDEPFDSELGPIDYPGDPNADPKNVWNCFIGETKVASDSEIVRSYKHDYSGELFVIETACGVQFTCTPNHPILTPSGWVGANRLNEGDNILVAGISDDDTLGVNPDIDHVFPRFDALHELFNKSFSERTTGLSVNFHGDIATANVEVVSKERFLMDDGNASISEVGKEFQFIHPDSFVLAKRHLMPGFRRINVSALRLMRRTGKPLPFLRRGLRHAIVHGFRTIPWGDTSVFEPKPDSMTSDMKLFSQGFNGFPGKVFVDNIVNIKITTVSHIPVFNLQTRNGYYFVNDIIPQNGEKCNGFFAIAHNCRCTLVYVYPDYPSEMQRRDNETGEVVGDMTYREWEQMKRGEGEQPEPKHGNR